jgi:hypothetical protein
MRRGFVIAAAICSLTACRQQSTYYSWGSYEQSVRQLTHAEGAVDVNAQIQSLTEQLERTRQEGGRIPPGLHAHLGLLYSMRGDLDTARAAFESERELFPESATFIDGVIERMGGK